MQQVVDLHSNSGFQALGVELLSVSPDSLEDWAEGVREFKIETPALSDPQNKVASKYDVMKWQAATGEPGHTFVLVDADGQIAWIRDFGAPENGGQMYVLPVPLTQEIAKRLPGLAGQSD